METRVLAETVSVSVVAARCKGGKFGVAREHLNLYTRCGLGLNFASASTRLGELMDNGDYLGSDDVSRKQQLAVLEFCLTN